MCMGFLDSVFGQRQTYPTVGSILPDVVKREIESGRLPRLTTDNLFLKKSEYCCYIDKALLLVEKTTKAYRHVGTSAPGLLKGQRITFGQGSPIEHKETLEFKGILYITNKRVILQCKDNGFDKLHRYLTAIKPYSNGVELQYGNKTYSLIVPDGALVNNVLRLVN